MRVAFHVPGKTVSVNATYRAGRGFRTSGRSFRKSPEAVAFQQRIALAARAAMRRAGMAMTEAPCAVWIEFVASSPLCDVDGPIKLCLDALAGKAGRRGAFGGGVYANDRQVEALSVHKRVDRARPGLWIEVFTLDEPAADLEDDLQRLGVPRAVGGQDPEAAGLPWVRP